MHPVQNFIPDLQDHLLSRIIGHAFSGEETEYSRAERNSVRFTANRIYFHKTLRVNYTTYDMQRSQDVINPSSHADIMVLSHEDDSEADPHPYWYARVINIFHVNVYRDAFGEDPRTAPQRMDVAWIRWFGRDLDEPSGFSTKRLPKIGFVPYGTGEPFGFLDPALIIRSAHIMPSFEDGRTDTRLPRSLARAGQNKHEDDPAHHDSDYAYYYVNM